MDRKLLGRRIREERLRVGLTQEQIAEKVNVSTTYIGFIERGERSVTLEKLILLAECFQLPIDALLHDAQPQEPEARERQLKMLWNLASDSEQETILSIIKVITGKPGGNHP
ncbi:MAG: helix-turn-helix transcriptional regulator [Lachnospiraceae bacterium]|nr:helix-turn-helix transcriptional regulator [Lachnospiraceae bacterium]